jgi:hypothetical protein
MAPPSLTAKPVDPLSYLEHIQRLTGHSRS